MDLRDSDAALLAKSGRRAEAERLARPQKAVLDPIQRAMGLPSPVWENQDSSKLTDGQCSVFGGSGRCPAAAAYHVWIGCAVGEHLDCSDVCEPHGTQMAGSDGVYYCRRCWDALCVISQARVIKVERMDDGTA